MSDQTIHSGADRSRQAQFWPDILNSIRSRVFGVNYSHQKTVLIQGKSVLVEWSNSAERALANRTSPLLVELQLYFSCTIVRRVNFPDDMSENVIKKTNNAKVNDTLQVFFNPVMKESCDVEQLFARSVPYTDFPIQDSGRFVPKGVRIDFQNNQWLGEYRM